MNLQGGPGTILSRNQYIGDLEANAKKNTA